MAQGVVIGMGYDIGNTEEAIATLVNEYGHTVVQAVGCVANFVVESRVIPTVYQWGGGPGRGIAQWGVGGRWDSLVAWCATHGYPSPWTLQAQLAFMQDELQSTEENAGALLGDATTAADAAAVMQTYYERPANGDTTLRRAIADSLFTTYGGHVQLSNRRGGVGYHCPATLQWGVQGDYVTWLQCRLAVPVQDGKFGGQTRQYVETFQERYRLQVDGIAGPLTLGRLGWVVG